MRVDGENNGQMGDGFSTPPFGDEEFREMLAQGMVLGSLFDDRHEGVDKRIRHAHKPTGWQACGSTNSGSNRSECARGDPAQRLAGAPRVHKTHREGQGDEGGQQGRFGGDCDASDGEETNEPGELHTRAGCHDRSVAPGGTQGGVRVGEDHKVFVVVPFLMPPARHDDKGGEEHEENQASPQDDRESQGGELFDDGFGHG